MVGDESATKKPRIVFITGLSGAGMKTAINILEDSGVYCIDNLPLEMIESALTVIERGYLSGEDKVLVFGFRPQKPCQVEEFRALKSKLMLAYRVDVLFLAADPVTVEDRYGANRRKHPFLNEGVCLAEAIAAEMALLLPIEEEATLVLDTSSLSPQELAHTIESRYADAITPRQLNVAIMSFGFKHGPPRPLDAMFDVRFLRNPFFITSMRHKTGLDAEVTAYIFKDPTAHQLVERLVDWHRWLLPKYYDEGKHYLRIGIGCTGGQHRSVAIVEALAKELGREPFAKIILSKGHRDLNLPLS